MKLKLTKTRAYNPSTKAFGYRATVKSNGKADMEALVASAAKNTTMHQAELRMAFELMLDAIDENLKAGNIIELKGIGNLYYSVSGPMTETPNVLPHVRHTIGIAFMPSQEIQAVVKGITTTWGSEVADEEENNAPAPEQKPAPTPEGGTTGEGEEIS